MTPRRLIALAATAGIVAAAVSTAGCSTPSPSPSPSPAPSATSLPSATAGSARPATPAPSGADLPASQIPWNQVGPGWFLATWSPAPGLPPGEHPPAGQPAVAPETLYLFDPAGRRYAITTLAVVPSAVPGDLAHDPALADWSGDGRHALFVDAVYGPNARTTLTEVDLATGAQQDFTVTGRVDGAYTRPTGQAILLSTSGGAVGPSTVQRVDLTGADQLTYPSDLGSAGTFSGGFPGYLQSPDGTRLVLAATNGLVIVGNDGRLGRQLPMPGPLTDCSPVRWWTPTTVLARCKVPAHDGLQLWQVPVDGGAPRVLTADAPGQDPAYHADEDAWQLPSGTFLQSQGPHCASGYLTRLTPDTHIAEVTVPGVDHGVHVIGTTDDKLLIQAALTPGDCGSTTALLTYAPATNTATVLLGPPVNGGHVLAAILHPTP